MHQVEQGYILNSQELAGLKVCSYSVGVLGAMAFYDERTPALVIQEIYAKLIEVQAQAT